ncbi:hypothetical protein [Gimesia panareensis]|uniref:hypothetical protein n=1 Tax=Gimesia panareensis TaxID=2527978 RepID=UPI001188B5A7|nr:hypothetical protein [Gimesia panareensis]QDU50904.1 hypothetical protein Pan110_32650 [Gimesia panareensis]
MPVSWGTIIVELVLILPVGIYLYYSMFKKIRLCEGKVCPQCQTPLKPFQHPLTRNWEQWKKGGFRCHKCHCLTDLDGKLIHPGPYPTRRIMLLSLLWMFLFYLLTIAMLVLFYLFYVKPNG